MEILHILFLVVLILIFMGVIWRWQKKEDFTVDFIPYAEPYFGYCTPGLDAKDWKSGNFETKCWNNFAYEDCELLNQNGYNCGFNIKTGEKLECVHKEGKCKDDNQCFSTCYEQIGNANAPYMIKVNRDNLIGLSA